MHLAGICIGSMPNFPFYHYFQNVKWCHSKRSLLLDFKGILKRFNDGKGHERTGTFNALWLAFYFPRETDLATRAPDNHFDGPITLHYARITRAGYSKRDVCFPRLGVWKKLPANIRGSKRFCPAVDGVKIVQHMLLPRLISWMYTNKKSNSVHISEIVRKALVFTNSCHTHRGFQC